MAKNHQKYCRYPETSIAEGLIAVLAILHIVVKPLSCPKETRTGANGPRVHETEKQ
jgi:hypothetical protein